MSCRMPSPNCSTTEMFMTPARQCAEMRRSDCTTSRNQALHVIRTHGPRNSKGRPLLPLRTRVATTNTNGSRLPKCCSRLRQSRASRASSRNQNLSEQSLVRRKLPRSSSSAKSPLETSHQHHRPTHAPLRTRRDCSRQSHRCGTQSPAT